MCLAPGASAWHRGRANAPAAHWPRSFASQNSHLVAMTEVPRGGAQGIRAGLLQERPLFCRKNLRSRRMGALNGGFRLAGHFPPRDRKFTPKGACAIFEKYV